MSGSDQITKTIHTVSELPLIGSALALGKDSLEFVKKVAQECGDAGQFHLGPVTGYLFNTSEAVGQVLVEKTDAFDKGSFTLRAYRNIHNNPVLIKEGQEHQQERQILNPIFQPEEIASYAETMKEFAIEAQSDWLDGQIVDIQNEMLNLTLRIMGKVLFGLKNLSRGNELADALLEVPEYLSHGVKSPFLIPLFIPTPGNQRIKNALEVLERRFGDFNRVIDNQENADNTQIDMLSRLYKAGSQNGQRLNNSQIQDDAVEIFNAGCENVAVALAWCFYLLATHPEVLSRLQRELETVLTGNPPTYSDLPHLTYTSQVIKETLRLYPPIYIVLPRRALYDLTISAVPVRKGQMILVSPYTLHHRSDYFPEPERFDPDRFSFENEKQLPPYSFIPFNAGTHDCLGRHFAFMEAQMILVSLLQKVNFELVPDQQIVPHASLVLRQAFGCRVAIKRRLS